MKNKIPIIIDTDPGIDDSFCLAFAVAHQELFDIKAITTIGGNNKTAVTTRNALALLHLFHADQIPVAAGADAYLTRSFGTPVAKFHGENGLGNQEIPDAPKGPVQETACDLIYRIAKECDGKLVLVTVGPETNLALAFQKYPDLKDMIAKIIVMGGSLTKGNVTPYAEANIWHDVPAANIVFHTGIPIDMVGLNVTLKCPVSEETVEKLATETRPDVKDFMKALIRFRNGEAMHDAVAIGSFINEDMVTWKTGRIEIVTQDNERYGQTIIHEDPDANMRAAEAVDLKQYEELFIKTANYFSEDQ